MPTQPLPIAWRKRRRPRNVTLVVLALLITALAPMRAATAGQVANLPNAFWLDRMLTFYVVNDPGQNFDVTVEWYSEWQTQTDTPVYVRVLDPNELTISRSFEAGAKVTGTPVTHTISLPITANGAGIYQVIITGFTQTLVKLTVSPEMSWGVYGYPMVHSASAAVEAYVYLPPTLAQLQAQVTGTVMSLQMSDGNGIVHLSTSGTNATAATALPASTPDSIWRLTAQGAGTFGLNFGVAPIILCPDQATATAIHASVDVLDDGTICYHKFQKDAHAALAEYRAHDPASFDVPLPNLQSQAANWNSMPARSALLLGEYGVFTSLPATLAEQNLDPASPWFGTIYSWHDANGQERANPLTTYDRLGLTQLSPTLNALAAMYMIDAPYNTLHHNPNLLNRIIVAALQEVMMIREHELFVPEYVNYDGGEKAFSFAREMRWFPWVILDCPSDVRTILIEGLRRSADHMMLGAVPETANQWSFIMIGLQSFAHGSGEPFYADAVKRQIGWLLGRRLYAYGAMPAGYFAEGSGPETTYSGILLHNLAWLAEETGHVPLRKAVARCYRTLNHTIAPEPGSAWMGATSFAHRTPDPWTVAQWGAGVAMSGDDSTDAAVLVGRTWLPWKVPHNASQMQAQQALMPPLLIYHDANAYVDPEVGVTRLIEAPLLHVAAWEHFMNAPLVGQLPMKESDRFTRRLGDEFLCVRRPTYYAFLYCGKTMESWRQGSRPTDPNVQYPRNGGGLSMFWSPKFGSSILSQNWSAYATNSIVAVKGSQTFFENYWQTTSGIQESLARATINGDIGDTCLNFRRQLNFLEDRVQCDLRLQAKGANVYNNLWEVFPYPLDKPEPIKVKLYDANGVVIPGNKKTASAIVFSTTQANEVHIIAFSSPRLCEFGSNASTDVYGGPRKTGRVLTSLPLQWNTNQSRVFKWSMKAVRPNQVQQTIKQMIQAM